MSERRTFSVDIKVGESISVDRGRVVLTVVEKSGQRARLAIDAEKTVPVNKVELNLKAGVEQARKGVLSR